MSSLKRLSLLLGIVALVVVALIGWRFRPLPSDAELSQYYRRHEPMLNKLNKRLLSKQMAGSPVQVEDYRQFQEPLGLLGVEIENAGSIESVQVIRYLTHSRGIGVGSYGSGLAYVAAGVPDAGFAKVDGAWFSFRWSAD